MEKKKFSILALKQLDVEFIKSNAKEYNFEVTGEHGHEDNDDIRFVDIEYTWESDPKMWADAMYFGKNYGIFQEKQSKIQHHESK